MTEFEPAEWVAFAACRGLNPDLFFPGPGQYRQVKFAKQVCNGIPGATSPCPVRQECLDAAMRNEEKQGVWGGMSERQRRNIRTRWKIDHPDECRKALAWTVIERATERLA